MNNSRFGLTERNISSLYDIFNKYPEVKEVFIFGSRAMGNYKKGSDIDLAIMNHSISQKTIARILSDCTESSLPYKVDLVDFNSLSNIDFIDHIKRVGILFFKKEGPVPASNHNNPRCP